MLTIIIAKGAAVRAAAGGSRRFLPGAAVDNDNGLPMSHPVVLVPLIGLILIFIGAVVTCFCKAAPNRVPENFRVFGKRSLPQNENVELQLRRGDDRRPSESSQAARNGRSSRSPSTSRPSAPNPHRHSPHPPPPSPNPNNGNRSPYLYLPVQSSGRQPGSTNSSFPFSGTPEVSHRKDIPFTPPPTYETVQEFPHLFVPVFPTAPAPSPTNPLSNVQISK